MKLDEVKVITEFKQLQIREIRDDGRYHRRIIAPDMDVLGEDQKIQDLTQELWTDEIKTAWDNNQKASSSLKITSAWLFSTSNDRPNGNILSFSGRFR